MTNRTNESIARDAAELGGQVGAQAAEWIDLSNCEVTDLMQLLSQALGLDDDPEVADRFQLPNLSGEMADGPTPATLQDELDWDPTAFEGPDEAEAVLDEACEAWENEVHHAFWQRLGRRVAAHLADNLEG